MGRELKRVPLNFKWEIGKVWKGYECEWEPEEPPKGKGFQLWETTTEGSPISPVFRTLEELCEWSKDNATIFGEFKLTKEEWMIHLKEDPVVFKRGNLAFI